ncbi:MAG: tRNA 4-thiouridine(8) synthase ThiI [Candidatus Marinimicrobia bacterium]|nr:tRNA 4-thiouridine(8) synthase ThiI [Candidatus Neomarinimicrobiota bacterium]
MKPDVILCHYGEIGLKGKNRSYFEKKLQKNLRETIKRSMPGSFTSIDRLYGRIIIRLNEQGQNKISTISALLKNVCGLVYFAPAVKTEQDIGAITQLAVEMMSSGDYKTFRVTSRRTDKNFHVGSQKMNEDVGAAILKTTGKVVNLGKPDKTCFIDVVDGKAFIYTEKIRGQGGLPVGVSGKVVSLLSGGIDSPVSSFYMMKRGAAATFVHFHSVPYTNEASIEKVREMIEALLSFQLRATLYLIKLAPIQKVIMTETEAKFRVILYRRFMVRIAEAIAHKIRAKALITGDSLGQVASQTLENMSVIEEAVSIPILRPLIGFDKLEIIDKAKEINTYDISILPDQDCCSLFTPKHPATKAKLIDVLGEEKKLNVNELVKTALESAVIETFD